MGLRSELSSYKLPTWLLASIAVILAVVIGWLFSVNPLFGMGFFGIMVGIAVILSFLLSTEFGLYFTLVYSFFIFHISRIYFNDSFPVGSTSDLLIFSLFFSLIIRRINWRSELKFFFKSPVVVVILLLVAFLGAQLFNPSAYSFDGWYLTIRKSFVSVFLLFVSFVLFKDIRVVRRFFKILFIVAVIAGLYGCYQEWAGLSSKELTWVMSDEVRFGLLFINGSFRKFSTTSDAMAFGVIMAVTAITFTVLSFYTQNATRKVVLYTGVIAMILGMAYSGTRTANAMIVAGLFIYVLLTFNNKNTRIFTLIAGSILVAIIFGPFYSNPTINRFRSTFVASEDKSFNVREVNRARIQPYIHQHPIGGGLGTTGTAGQTFNPGHPLAGFPPDSGYLKKALETGWIGLGIICILYFLVLRQGIIGYFRTKDIQIKQYYAATLCGLFAFYVAEVAQDALGQIMDTMVYYPFMAVIISLNRGTVDERSTNDLLVKTGTKSITD